MDLIKTLAENLALPATKINNTVRLLQEGNTIPFIARYRKEITGNLDEEQIRSINSEWQRLENLEDRRQTILQSVSEQGKLTDQLQHEILNAINLTALEDLYLPYRPKRRTRAMIAREKGLEPLANLILQQMVTDEPLTSLVSPFLRADVPDTDAALTGASDIIAEIIGENAAIRQSVREKGFSLGTMLCTRIADAEDKRQVYALYYQFELRVKYLRPHQVLAINRGEAEKILKVTLAIPESAWLPAIHTQYPLNRRSVFHESLTAAIHDGAKRLLLPSIERDIRRQLSEDAETHAIQVFARNLKGLLTQPPLDGRTILAIDPGFRTGSKIAVVDPTGKMLDVATIYPHPPQNRRAEAVQSLRKLIKAFQVNLIVIGNGTASRETEALIADLTKQDPDLHYLITSEAGASVYSASDLARKEFPELDVSMRSAISIARRVQDPLAELVKIDPKSIGVGLYQHDVNQAQLSEALDQVVESVVNAIGVDVNTASAPLLTYVAGIGPALAEKIVGYRDENGPFNDRAMFKDVPGMGPKSFEQAAGFLRIRNSRNPLDATAIHPESYPVAQRILDQLPSKGVTGTSLHQALKDFKANTDLQALAHALETGLPTLEDILSELARPGRDPREDAPKPILRDDVLSMADLTQGMHLKGTIRNVVDFGAFVDIGVKVDGLLHRSRYKQGHTLAVGDIIDVTIMSVDQERERIALEMRESVDDC